MSRPATGKRRRGTYLIMVGFISCAIRRVPPHAALAEAVEGAAGLIKRSAFEGLINGVLRQFQRGETLAMSFATSDGTSGVGW